LEIGTMLVLFLHILGTLHWQTELQKKCFVVTHEDKKKGNTKKIVVDTRKDKKKENRKLGPCSSFVTHEDKKKKKKLQKNSLLKHIKTKKKKKFANWAHARREQRGSTFWQTQLIFGSIRSGF
jgi:hypothetical protein